MRFFASFAVLLLAGACASSGAVTPSAPLTFRTVADSGYASREEAGEVLAFDDESYRELWDQLASGGNPPAIDFSTETAVFLFGGMKPSGGYTYEVRGVRLEGDTLVVEGGIKAPPSRAPAATVMTSPFSLIAVKSRAIRNVRVQP
jgi:hypothetical protein